MNNLGVAYKVLLELEGFFLGISGNNWKLGYDVRVALVQLNLKV